MRKSVLSAGIAWSCAPGPATTIPGKTDLVLSRPGESPAPGASAAPAEPPHQVERAPSDPSQWRGVWLNHAAMLEGPAAIGKLLNDFVDAGINIVFPNTWYRGKLSYPGSAFAPQDSRFAGWDPLAFVVAQGLERGMKVMPWFEYGFITHYSTTGDPRDVGQVLGAHADWAALDRAGNVALPHSDHRVYFYSLSPVVPDARTFLRDLVLDAARHAPADGIQLDRIRFPARDTSYDATSRGQFGAIKADPASLAEDDEDWVKWRQQQVSAFMAELRPAAAAVLGDRPVISAVLPSSANRGHYQDWAAWCAAGTLHVAVPLAFNASQDYVEREIAFAQKATEGTNTRLAIGLAAMHAGTAGLAAQVAAATRAGAGVVLWDDQWVRSNLDAVRSALAD